MAETPEGEPLDPQAQIDSSPPGASSDDELLRTDDLDRLFTGQAEAETPQPAGRPKPKPKGAADVASDSGAQIPTTAPADDEGNHGMLTNDDYDELLSGQNPVSIDTSAGQAVTLPKPAHEPFDGNTAAIDPQTVVVPALPEFDRIVMPDKLRRKIIPLLLEIFGPDYTDKQYLDELQYPADLIVRLTNGAVGNADLCARLAPILTELPIGLVNEAISLAKERGLPAVEAFIREPGRVDSAATAVATSGQSHPLQLDTQTETHTDEVTDDSAAPAAAGEPAEETPAETVLTEHERRLLLGFADATLPDYDRDIKHPDAFVVNLVVATQMSGNSNWLEDLADLIGKLSTNLRSAAARLASERGEAQIASFINSGEVAQLTADSPAEPETQSEAERLLAERGLKIGDAVWLLPDVDDAYDYAEKVAEGGRPADIAARRYTIIGINSEDHEGTVTLESSTGSSLDLEASLIGKLLSVDDTSRGTFNFNGDECHIIITYQNGKGQRYQFGIAPSGVVRYHLMDEEPDTASDSDAADGDNLDVDLPTFVRRNLARAQGARDSSRQQQPPPPTNVPPRETGPNKPAALPRYFLSLLQDVLGPDYQRFLDSTDPDEKLEILNSRQVPFGEERKEVDARAVELLEKLRDDAAAHLGPDNYDRVLNGAKTIQRAWGWARKLGLTKWANEGGKWSRVARSIGLGMVSGLGMRLFSGAVAHATRAGGWIPGLGAVGTGMAAINFTSVAHHNIERGWLEVKVDKETRQRDLDAQIRRMMRYETIMERHHLELLPAAESTETAGTPVTSTPDLRFKDTQTGKEYVYSSTGKPPKVLREFIQEAEYNLDRAYHIEDNGWVERLETSDLLHRIADARLYLCRRENRADTPENRTDKNSALDFYQVLINEAISRCGADGVAAVLSEADTALTESTSGKQFRKAAKAGVVGGAVTFLAGYALSHFVLSHVPSIFGHHSASQPEAEHTPAGQPAGSAPPASTGPTSGAPATSAPTTGVPTTGAPSVLPPEAAPGPVGGGEWHLNSSDGFSTDEVHKAAEVWMHPAAGAETNLHEMQYAEHSVRASIAAKLGLWADNGDGTGHLTGEWKTTSEWTDDSGVHHTVREMVNAPTSNGVNLAPVRLVDGQFDFSKLTIAPDNHLAAEINAGPWQTPWGEFRAAQLITKLNDVTTLAHVSGYSVDTLQAHPDLTAHLREQARGAIMAQLGVGANGQTLPMPKIGGMTLAPSSNSMDILDGPLGGALHREAAEYAQSKGIQLIEPAPETTSAAVSGGGYQGLWGVRHVTSAPQPGEPGYTGWGDTSTAQREIPDMTRDAVLERTAPRLRQEGLIPPVAKPIEPVAGQTPLETAVPRPSGAAPVAPTGQPLPPVEPKLPAPPAAPDLKPASIGSNPLEAGEQIGGAVKPVIDLKPTPLQPGEALGGSVTPTTP